MTGFNGLEYYNRTYLKLVIELHIYLLVLVYLEVSIPCDGSHTLLQQQKITPVIFYGHLQFDITGTGNVSFIALYYAPMGQGAPAHLIPSVYG